MATSRLSPEAQPPITPQFVDCIHEQEHGARFIARDVNILFTVGGNGTQRGANDLYQEARKRGHPLAVVRVPKTIDNDVTFVSRTFGFTSAVEEAKRVLRCAHTEARSVARASWTADLRPRRRRKG